MSVSSRVASMWTRKPARRRATKARRPKTRTAAEGEPEARSAEVACMSAWSASAPESSTAAKPSSTEVAHQPPRQPSTAAMGAGVTRSALVRPMRKTCAPAGASASRPRIGAPGARVAMAASSSPEIRVWPSPPSLLAVRRARSTRSSAAPRGGARTMSRMEPLPFRIERDRGRDGRAALATQMIDADRFAHAREPRFDKAERDRAAQRRAHGARRYVALRSPRPALAARDMRPGRQRRFARRNAQADQLLAARILRDRHGERALADIFVVPRIAWTRDPEIVRHGRPVGVLADDDEAFLGAQDHQRLEAEKPGAERIELCGEAGAQGASAARGNRELIGAVAGEAHPRDAERAAVEGGGRKRHVRQARIVELQIEAASLDEVARARAGDGERRPLGGRVVNGDAAGVEAVLPPQFEAHANRVRMAGRTRDEKAVIGEAQGHAVVEHDSILGQKEAVADASGFQGRKAIVAVEVGESGGVGADDLD